MTTTTGVYDPEAHADELGLAVRAHLLPGRRWGAYLPDRGLILLRPGMRRALRRWALAHEVAHHLAGDGGCADPRARARAERAAEEWAAARLVAPAAWDEACAAYEHPVLVAAELDLPPHAVAVCARLFAGHPVRSGEETR